MSTAEYPAKNHGEALERYNNQKIGSGDEPRDVEFYRLVTKTFTPGPVSKSRIFCQLAHQYLILVNFIFMWTVKRRTFKWQEKI